MKRPTVSAAVDGFGGSIKVMPAITVGRLRGVSAPSAGVGGASASGSGVWSTSIVERGTGPLSARIIALMPASSSAMEPNRADHAATLSADTPTIRDTAVAPGSAVRTAVPVASRWRIVAAACSRRAAARPVSSSPSSLR
jgi:hypothetical protein